jgi:uncharacterized protein YbaP (TraB family)
MQKILTVACALLILAVAPGPSPQAQATSPHHTLWTVKGKTNTVYLLGSVHFLSPAEQLPSVVDQAYRDSEKLVMEIDMDDLDPKVVQQLTVDLGLLPSNETLQSKLGPQVYAQVAKQAQAVGLDPGLLSRLRPWFAALTLVQLNLKQMGLDAESGVEQKLVARAAIDHKEILGLETIQQQLGMLSGLADKQQREFLLYSVEDMDRAKNDIDELIAAWRKGDTRTLAQLLTEGLDEYPDLYRPLTVDRNRQWLASIEKLLTERDDYLVVVGALHLVGKDSLIDLLQQHGHKAQQQ